MDTRIEALLKEAEYELFHYPEFSLGEMVKYGIKRLLRPGNTPPRDRFFWPHAMLAQGLMTAAVVLPQQEERLTEVLERYYGMWIRRGMPISEPDHAMHGVVLLHLYESTGDYVYLRGAEKLYGFLTEYTKKMGNPLPYRKHHPTHVYADGLGMMVPFLSRYGMQCNCPQAAELAMGELKAFWNCGMDPVTGLPYHGYDTKTKEKQGIIGWGRAVGWLMLALGESLAYQRGAHREWIRGKLVTLAEQAAAYVKPEGELSWQLQAVEGPTDTSAMAMIGCGLVRLQESEEGEDSSKGEFHGDLRDFAELLENALRHRIQQGKISQCSGECMGFAQYPQIYGAYPWSLGPGLMFLLLRQRME